MILNTIARCKRHLAPNSQPRHQLSEEVQAQKLAEEILCSFPYHLNQPGSVAAGLLILHPLWVVATNASISDSTISCARDCLMWIGREMGIGQANLLADVSELSTNLLLVFLRTRSRISKSHSMTSPEDTF